MSDIIKRLKHCIAHSAGLVQDEKQTMIYAIQRIAELEAALEQEKKYDIEKQRDIWAELLAWSAWEPTDE